MKWKVCLVTLIGVFLFAHTNGADTNATSTTTTTTIAPKPKVNTKDSALCKKCKCDFEVFLLDCRNKSMKSWFNDDEWNTLANGDVLFETVRLEHNNITNIPVLNAMPVKNLYLSHNAIDKIAKGAFHNLLNLKILDLSYNRITSKVLVPEVFEGNYNTKDYEPLPNVIELDLGHNSLHTLDADIFEHLPKLEILILGANTFHVIDHSAEIAIGGLAHLKTLDLSYMELDDLPDNLLHAPRDLENLILTGNILDDIPDGMGLAINLKRLTFDENPMGNLGGENVFPNLTKLEFLSISYSNDLVRIDNGSFSNLPGLKTLVLSSNPKLSYIHPKAFAKATVNPIIFDYPPITELFLHNNNLSALDHDLLERWDKVKTIDLRLNPWACDCDNSWLIHTLMTQINDTTPQLVKNVLCATPSAWNAVPLMELNADKKNLRCIDDTHPENDGRLLIGLLVGILVGIPLTFGALILYRRGCFGMLNRSNSAGHSLYNRASFNDDFHI